MSDTNKKSEEHTELFKDNKDKSASIDKYVRMIATKKAKIELMKLKIM